MAFATSKHDRFFNYSLNAGPVAQVAKQASSDTPNSAAGRFPFLILVSFMSSQSRRAAGGTSLHWKNGHYVMRCRMFRTSARTDPAFGTSHHCTNSFSRPFSPEAGASSVLAGSRHKEITRSLLLENSIGNKICTRKRRSSHPHHSNKQWKPTNRALLQARQHGGVVYPDGHRQGRTHNDGHD